MSSRILQKTESMPNLWASDIQKDASKEISLARQTFSRTNAYVSLNQLDTLSFKEINTPESEENYVNAFNQEIERIKTLNKKPEPEIENDTIKVTPIEKHSPAINARITSPRAVRISNKVILGLFVTVTAAALGFLFREQIGSALSFIGKKIVMLSRKTYEGLKGFDTLSPAMKFIGIASVIYLAACICCIIVVCKKK